MSAPSSFGLRLEEQQPTAVAAPCRSPPHCFRKRRTRSPISRCRRRRRPIAACPSSCPRRCRPRAPRPSLSLWTSPRHSGRRGPPPPPPSSSSWSGRSTRRRNRQAAATAAPAAPHPRPRLPPPVPPRRHEGPCSQPPHQRAEDVPRQPADHGGIVRRAPHPECADAQRPAFGIGRAQWLGGNAPVVTLVEGGQQRRGFGGEGTIVPRRQDKEEDRRTPRRPVFIGILLVPLPPSAPSSTSSSSPS